MTQDMTLANLATMIAHQQQQKPRNIGLPSSLPESPQGGTDYRPMLSALQSPGQAPGFSALNGMRFEPGAGFLPQLPPMQMPEMPQTPPLAPPTIPSLGGAGGGLGGLSRDQINEYLRHLQML